MAERELVEEIDAFLGRSGMSASAFGSAAVGDPAFVHEVRKGRTVRARTRDRVTAFISGHARPARREAADTGLAEEAKALGIDVDAVVTSALRDKVREEKARRWRAENAGAIEAYNSRIEAQGVFSEKLRRF